ncbi:MAG TPA: hypothetical protein VLS45_04085, partial [Methylomicrobium sp.]|nr:hypothetical protein [Methylomicrobium sp.]
VDTVTQKGAALGLHLNRSKCEIISNHVTVKQYPQLQDFQLTSPSEATLLGAPLSAGSAMDTILSVLHDNLKHSVNRLRLLSSHDALVLLKASLGGPKLHHILRSAPCCDHPLLPQIDTTLKSAITQICNVTLSDQQWSQASLPVRHGGLGIRSVAMLAPSAFLASAAGTQKLQSLILQKCHIAVEDISHSSSLSHWALLSGSKTHSLPADNSQRSLDNAISAKTFKYLFDSKTDPVEQARLLAAAADHSGDWLHAIPISSCGLRLSDEAIRVAVSTRLGVELCQAHQCSCGTKIDTQGLHIFSCKRNSGRGQRHHFLNDIIWRALTRASIPSLKEPHGLARSDGKRPDGLTLIPWQAGRSATWDVTVADTLAASYITDTSKCAAAAAEAAASRKETKYASISQTHLFFPLAFETLGPINQAGHDFISAVGHRTTLITDDPRDTSFLYQRLSIAMQRFNAILLSNSFCLEHTAHAIQPRHT